MYYAVNTFKPFVFEKSRSFCSICGKPHMIDDDDLGEVYSPSDYCLCHLKRRYD
jgi:hypothetical protein